MKTSHVFAVALTLLAAALSQSPAAVIVVAPTAGTSGSLQFTSDITFTITVGGAARIFALDEWVVADATFTTSNISPGLQISTNGGAPVPDSSTLTDNVGGTVNDLTAKDGFIETNSNFNVVPGNTLTLKAGIYSLGAASSFNPQATQTFTGTMFVTDSNGNRMSGNVVVPEPSAFALLGAGSLALLRRRRLP